MKCFKIIVMFLMLFQVVLHAQKSDAIQHREYHTKAVQAYYAKDYKGWLEYNKKAVEILPDHPRSIYYLADAYALNGDTKNAIKYLKRAVEMGLGWSAGEDPDFKSLKEVPEFKKLLMRIGELKKPVNNSNIAFTLQERDIIPEGLAYDPVEECFYLSSIFKCKVIKIDKDGKFSNFTSIKQDGLRPVVGMKVDAKRRILWVCSEVSSMNYINSDSTEMGWSGVFKYDLKTGKLIKKYTVFEKGVIHLFNDIVVTQSGDVFLTDSRSQEIYMISVEKDELEVFMKNEGFGFLNGIALSVDEKSIFVADDGSGIVKINLDDKKMKYLEAPKHTATIGIDGLYLHDNTLIAVQNGLGGEARATRFYLDKDGKKIIKSEILELGNPHFIIPTTGAVAGNDFYFIANSQLRSFNKDHDVLPWDQLKDVIILKTKLK